MSDIEIYRALPADEREELGFAQWRKVMQITTHFPGCYDHGQHHYQCARTEIKRLQESIAQPVQPASPLTDEQLDRVLRSVDYTLSYEDFRLAVGRAVEKAHGIGATP